MYDYTTRATKPKYCAACKHSQPLANAKARCTAADYHSIHLALVPRDCRQFDRKEAE